MALIISINAIGKISEKEILSLMQDYSKRVKWDLKINEFSNSKSQNVDTAKVDEEKLLWSKCADRDYVIAMDEKGDELTSTQFAALLSKLEGQGVPHIHFLIGGADGHTDNTRAKANKMLSLSKMTLPHKIARLVLVEQLYRAFSITKGHPYHRDG